MQALEGLQLLIRPGWMRLEACKVHRTAATADREKERVARAGCGKRSRHGVALLSGSNQTVPTAGNRLRGIAVFLGYFKALLQGTGTAPQ
jgi:hypothetical protein